jgi:hypothetical protein
VVSCRGNALELAVVGAGHRRPEEDTITLRDELIKSHVEIGECLEKREASLPHPTGGPLIGEVVADRVQISTVDHLVVIPPDQILVLL